MVSVLAGQQALQFKTRWTRALHHRYSATQRDGCAAHGSHAEQHHSGHSCAPCTHGGQERLLGARHRPCLDSHRGQGGEEAGRAGHQEARPDARRVSEARLGLDPRARRHHPEAAAPPGCLLRLGPHGLHDGREALGERHQGVCRPLQQGTHLSRPAHGELGPEGTDSPLDRGGDLQGGAQPPVPPEILCGRISRTGWTRRTGKRGQHHPQGRQGLLCRSGYHAP